MLALDSPRWKELRHAYGSAEAIPTLIKHIAAEREPMHSIDLAAMRAAPSPWEEVYNSLCHQYTIYSATYAAFPHLVLIAQSGTVGNRLETLVLSGAISAFGITQGEVPEDLRAPFDEAMATMKLLSREILAQAETEKRFERYPLPYLIQAVLALRFGQVATVQCIERLMENDSEISAECPFCQTYCHINLAEIPLSMPVDERGFPIEKKQALGSVDKASLALDLQRGRDLLQQPNEDNWKEGQTVEIAAALASFHGDTALANRILNFHAQARCPECKMMFQVEEGLM